MAQDETEKQIEPEQESELEKVVEEDVQEQTPPVNPLQAALDGLSEQVGKLEARLMQIESEREAERAERRKKIELDNKKDVNDEEEKKELSRSQQRRIRLFRR